MLLLTALVVIVGYRLAPTFTPASRPPQPWPVRPSPAATVDLGVTTTPLGQNAWREWQAADLQSVNAFEQTVRKHVSIVMWYSGWQHNEVSLPQLNAVAARGSIPEITWEPWDFTKGLYSHQPNYTLASTINGHHDAYIRSCARALASYGKPVRLRFAQEMNGNWYPWSENANTNHVGQFVKAWRHIHDIFRAAGANNVLWVWSPVALAYAINGEQYPGRNYVDIVGLSAFNGGSELKYSPWKTFAAKMDASLALLKKIAPGKAIEISEVGAAEEGGSKPQWITDMFQALKTEPEITALIWYDIHTTADWRIESSKAAEEAFAAGVSDPRYR